jgi:hypothetical protein
MANHTVKRIYQDTSATAILQSETISGDTERNFDASLAIGANHEIDIAFTRANLKSLCITSDLAVTVYTNDLSSGSPQDTIAIVAGQALVWTLATDGIGKCPFSNNVTKLYVTNGAGGAATFKVRSLQNQKAS